MRAPALIVLCAVIAAGTAVCVQLLMQESETSAAPAVAPDVGGEAEALAALRAELREVRMELEELRALPQTAPAARSEVIDVEAAVLAVLREQGITAGDSVVAASDDEGDAAGAEDVTVDDLMAMLRSEDLSDTDRSEVWRRAREAGLSDELIAAFEAHAKDNPNDPDAQTEVGYAYLAKIGEVTDGPSKGQWGMKADEAFDRALEIDPNHWDARFTKATSLAFWPPIFGKQNEAISHFEILVEKQKNLPRDPKHAQTYLLLGNLYQQQGKTDEAAQIWANGAQLFPNDEALAGRIGGGGN